MWLKEKILGGKKKQETVTLLIPDEALAIIETSDLEGAKALMVVNRALKEHQQRAEGRYRWLLEPHSKIQ